MDITLKDKVAIITGASSGIGAEIAILFSKLQASLVLHGRNEQGLDETISKCDIKSKIVKVLGDVREPVVLKLLVEETLKNFGKIDILVNNEVNNVGIFFGRDNIEDIEMKNFDEIFQVNVRSAVELTHLCVEHLIKTKGNIINVSSISGTKSFGFELSYEISKAALDQFTRCISLELAPKGVRVNSVNPCEVPTKMQERAGITDEDYFKKTASFVPMGRNATTSDVARAVAFLVSDAATFITGEFIHLAGGLQNQCVNEFTNID